MAKPGKRISLKKHPSDWTFKYEKESAKELLSEGVRKLSDLQDRLYAQNTHAILLIFQAMDAAGKDGTIKHVMSGINPQGCQVYSFKAPSPEERDHGYLWRSMKALPERGRIGIHNRSYYEEVLAVRVHREFLDAQQLPEDCRGKRVWADRFRQINDFEQYLVENGTIPIKFFLHVSKKEQKRRFLERIDTPDKNWKFSAADVQERQFWKSYMDAYEDVFTNTSTKIAPWYIIPADNKWFMRLAVSEVINYRLDKLNPEYPTVTDAHRRDLSRARRMLMNE